MKKLSTAEAYGNVRPPFAKATEWSHKAIAKWDEAERRFLTLHRKIYSDPPEPTTAKIIYVCSHYNWRKTVCGQGGPGADR